MSDPSVDRRIVGIDGVRAYAVVAVIAAHCHVFWLHGGGVGVDMFFGISGFLITFLLIGEHRKFGRIDLRKFWLRRVLRLFPALLLVVLVVALLAIAASLVRENEYLATSIPAIPSVLLYFSNWMIVGTDSSFLGWFGPLWSLSVEEQFYFVWPVVVILAMRTKRPLRLLTVIAAVVGVVAAVGRFFAFDGTNFYRTFGTDFRVDMILAGVLLAIALRAGQDRSIRRASRVLVAPAVGFLIFVSIFVPEFGRPEGASLQLLYYRYGLPLVALSTVTILGFIVTHQQSRFAVFLSLKPIEYTGKISYGMYLWHYPIIMAIQATLPFEPDRTMLFIVALPLTYVAAGLSFRFLENPLQDRYRDRIKPTVRASRADRPGGITRPSARTN
jgi:peptidoglycan/LPS O-acetylase OafA/YrhL